MIVVDVMAVVGLMVDVMEVIRLLVVEYIGDNCNFNSQW